MPQPKEPKFRTKALVELRAAVKEKGWNQEEFAAQLGRLQGLVQPWLAGDSRPSLRYRWVIYRLFGKRPGLHPDNWLTSREYREIYGESRP